MQNRVTALETKTTQQGNNLVAVGNGLSDLQVSLPTTTVHAPQLLARARERRCKGQGPGCRGGGLGSPTAGRALMDGMQASQLSWMLCCVLKIECTARQAGSCARAASQPCGTTLCSPAQRGCLASLHPPTPSAAPTPALQLNLSSLTGGVQPLLDNKGSLLNLAGSATGLLGLLGGGGGLLG